MVWIAAGIADASIRGQVVPKVHADRDWPLIGLIECPVGFQFLVAGVQATVSVGIEGTSELPAFGVFRIWLNNLWADFNPTLTPQYGFLTVPISALGCQPFRVSR